MRSTSSIVLEYLRKQPESFTYTAQSLLDLLKPAFPTVTLGGIGGWSSKNADGTVLQATKIGRYQSYTVLDLSQARSREGSSAGGSAGRESHHVNRLRAASVASIQARLLDLAAELELARTPLDTYSSEELLSELTRRQKANK